MYFQEWPEDESSVDIESVCEPQLKRLPPLLWLELTALFDKYSLPFQKRKPPKKKRKEGNQIMHITLFNLFFLFFHPIPNYLSMEKRTG